MKQGAAIPPETVCPSQELANSLTHGLGLLLSLVGLYFLIVYATLTGTAWHVTGCSLYGGTLVLLYAVSTAYHWIRNQRLKQVFRLLDHVSIYLLIAGTYTPFTLINLRGGWGWTLFGLVWGLAVIGITLKLRYGTRYEALSTLAYVLMGWVAVVAAKPIVQLIPPVGIFWIVLGGMFYTLGVFFYSRDRIPYYHAIWHLFVLAGSACHYCAVMFYVVPNKGF